MSKLFQVVLVLMGVMATGLVNGYSLKDALDDAANDLKRSFKDLRPAYSLSDAESDLKRSFEVLRPAFDYPAPCNFVQNGVCMDKKIEKELKDFFQLHKTEIVVGICICILVLIIASAWGCYRRCYCRCMH